jgi:hypothetical protein
MTLASSDVYITTRGIFTATCRARSTAGSDIYESALTVGYRCITSF